MTTKTYDNKGDGGAKDPITPIDLFADAARVPNTFGTVKAQQINRNMGSFDAKDYSDMVNPTVFDDPGTLRKLDAQRQPRSTQLGHGLVQLGANFASGFGQGVANMLDISSWGNDNYQSSLMGLSTSDMDDWAKNIARNFEIKRVNPGAFEPGSFAWGMEQLASAGTGLGMGAFALLETAAIEFATMGVGTGAAIGRLGSLFKRIKDTEGVASMANAASKVRDLRSAATVFGVLSRTNEARMEAMMSHKEIVDDMSSVKNPDGSAKYTEQEIEEYANAGADKTYMGNLALLPLDILGYRTMMYNPVSGAGKGFIERGLAKIGSKYVRGATQFGVTGALEGVEEGFQYIVSNEGKHYAKVLGGLDDSTSFLQRVDKAITGDEFWNNFAGGVIGSPIISGAMKLTNKVIDGGRTKMMQQLQEDYVKNIGVMDNQIANQITAAENMGRHKEANIMRKQFRAKKALGAIHWDAVTDRDTAFTAHVTYLQGVLDDVNKGGAEALKDIGFENPTPEQLEYVKKEYKESIDDAMELKRIYDSVKDKYNRNFVPEITADHFQLGEMLKDKVALDAKVVAARAKLPQVDQLSSFGREQYDANYELLTLHLERARLTEEFRETENLMEKENIDMLLKTNEARLTKIKTRLDEISKDTTYEAEQKTLDNDIIKSALVSPAYQRLSKDKEHMDNAISLKRKNLALWDNPKYLDQRNKAAVEKARTKEQAKNNKDAAAKKPGGITATEAEALEAKDKELAAGEAAQVADAQKRAAEGGMGNYEMFKEDNKYVEQMKGAKHEGGDFEKTGAVFDSLSVGPTTGEDVSESPAPINVGPETSAARQQLVTGVAGLIARLGGKPSFEDLIRHIAKVQGMGVADELFNAAIYGWQQNNMPEESYAIIYNKIFGDPMNDFMQGGKGAIDTDKKLSDATDAAIGPVIIQQNKGIQFDSNGQPKYFYRDKYGKRVYVTNEASPKFAFLTQFSELVRTETPEGIEISFDYTSDELNIGQYVDSLQLLDPDQYNEGVEMEIRRPPNYLDILVPVFNKNGTKGKAMPFGQWAATTPGITPESQEYRDKIPLIIYRKGAPVGEKGLAFVHDIGWYHPDRFDQNSPNEMAAAIASTREIREATLVEPGNPTTIVITEKRQTTFEGLKTNKGTEYNNITLREANPDTELTIAVSEFGLSTARGELGVRFPNNNETLMNIKGFRVGEIIDVRRFGTKDGKKTYMGYPVFRDKLDEPAKESIRRAVNIYANRNNPERRGLHQPVVDAIQKQMGLDIYSPQGLQTYLSHFMYIYNSKTKTPKGGNHGDTVAAAAATELAPKTPFVAFQGGHIIFGKAGELAYAKPDGTAVGTFFINPDTSDARTAEYASATFAEKANLDTYYEQNVDLPALNANKPVMLIGANYAVTMGAPTYKDYLLDRIKTNVRSFNIGTEAAPNRVTNIQPIITYELKSKLDKLKIAATNEEVRKDMMEGQTKEEAGVKEEAPKEEEEAPKKEEAPKEKEPSPEEVAAEKKRKMKEEFDKRAKKDLGKNHIKGGKEFKTGESMEDLAVAPKEKEDVSELPIPMGEAQTDYVKNSLLRIAGLTPSEQFDIVDFMYNRIVAMVDLDTATVTKAMVDAEVKKAFDAIIAPYEQEHKESLEFGQNMIAEFPETADEETLSNLAVYQRKLDKIQAVRDNFDVLQEEAYNRVAKYTGITQDKVTNEFFNDTPYSEENPMTNSTEEEIMFGGDFSTDVLTQSPEKKLTYSMRRFFGQIRKFDSEGKEMTGFLDLWAYTGADEIVRKLMQTLADTPADFDTMISKLEKLEVPPPWMKDAIARLKVATKQQQSQFVTVMDSSSLRMKFVMITENKKTNTWTTKVYDTNLNGVADAIAKQWRGNLTERGLNIVEVGADGHYLFNREKGKELMKQYESWIGKGLEQVPFDMEPYWPVIRQVTPARVAEGNQPAREEKTMTITAIGGLLDWLNTNLPNRSSRVGLTMKNQEYQVTKLGDNKFKVAVLNKQDIRNPEQVDKWLKELGITLQPDTLSELLNSGMYHNYKSRSPLELFTGANGLFRILYTKLGVLVNKEGDVHDFTEEGDNLLDDSVINSLATLDAKYNSSVSPFAFRDGQKSIFALTARKFITDTVLELKDPDNHALLQNLQGISYSSPSLWLQMLKSSPKFRTLFQVSHIGLTAFKQQGKKLYKDTGITKLADTDHELDKLGFFWDTTQGEVELQADGKAVLNKYPGTNLAMRMGTMFSPTMSDKDVMTLMTTAVLNLGNADLNNGEGGITDEVVKALYEQTVLPELKRMISHANKGHVTNLKSYDKGARMFLFMPALNTLKFSGNNLADLIYSQPQTYNLQFLETNEEIKEGIKNTIRKYVDVLVKKKLQVWETDGITRTSEKGEMALQFFDWKYMQKFRGDNKQKARMAATDYVVNYLISTSNSFMAIIGDPAQMYKVDPTTKRQEYEEEIDYIVQVVRDTFTNVGKRLANQIAPGTGLANSAKEQYLQLMLADREGVEAENIAYLERLYGVEGAAPYRNIDASDGQEYTTWKEHLDILSRLGKNGDGLMDITQEELNQAAEIFEKGDPLTPKQAQLVTKIMQPMKPVYTGRLHDDTQDLMRVVYIKCSAFPLIPQLTKTFELDKLRLEMEEIQKNRKMNVRASYQSANKVGGVTNPINVWNDDGTANDVELKAIHNKDENGKYTGGMIVLDRKHFRIQQDVPFKSGKTGEDTISLGTQLMKLLFGDEIITFKDFSYGGRNDVTGAELHRTYNDLFIDLIKEKKAQLYDDLGLDDYGIPINMERTMGKLQHLLKSEAIKRGYPLQDIEGLTLTDEGEFNLPLWASSNSNRYESMLNSIISNRIIKMKFPGTSSVVGSEEGFQIKRKQEDLKGVDESQIIYTPAWNGTHLTATVEKNGVIKKAQIFMASKFKGADGKLIDLFKKVNDKYIYIEQKAGGGFTLKQDMFDKELLSMLSFRIPTSGHQSASQIEIAGFLPAQSADLMIVPKNFTKQKGLDFDVDKENSYQFWTHTTKEGKVEMLQEKHRKELLFDADREMQETDLTDLKKEYDEATTPRAKKYVMDKARARIAETHLIGDLFESAAYDDKDLEKNKFLRRLNSRITEKLMQNELIKINHAVFNNPDEKIQAKIARVLNTKYAEAQAKKIEKLKLVGMSEDERRFWTPLDDEYQKSKLISGASGKIATGAFSLDVVFHSLAQQTRANGKSIRLVEQIDDLEGGEKAKKRTIDKIWRFGDVTSDPELGGNRTQDGSRSISEVVTEAQQIAVDNEKLQVMGWVGLNDMTLDVFKVFMLTGIDKSPEDGDSIPFLFLSQPIIQDFVLEMKNINSIVAGYDKNKEQTVIDKLIAKYDPEKKWDNVDPAEHARVTDSLLNNTNFKTAIKAEKPDGEIQRAVLERFLDMRKYGIAIRGIQTSINTDSKGLGKSFFDVIDKREKLNKIGVDSDTIQGASNLIGDYINKEGLPDSKLQELQRLGYTSIGKYMVKPDTLSGAFSVDGVMTAYNMWNRFFPYDSMNAEAVFKEILAVTTLDKALELSNIEKKQHIFQNIKKYLAAEQSNGLSDDEVNKERSRLFIDTEENLSLSAYLKAIKFMIGNKTVDEHIKTNQLINRFEFDIQKNGMPSLTKYNNADGEEFDEQYLYNAMSVMLTEKNPDGSEISLPTIGNKSYTLKTLAQDMILAAYIGSAVQEAIQYVKYVPVAYLDAMGYSLAMRLNNKRFDDNPKLLGLKDKATDGTQDHFVSRFTMQYIQHFPERVQTKYDMRSLAAAIIRNPDGTFVFKDKTHPTFVSVYDPQVGRGDKKFQLYYFDGKKYDRVAVLGAFGMDEYQPAVDIGVSSINARMKFKPELQPLLQKDNTTAEYPDFNIRAGDVTEITRNIGNSTTPFAPLARQLVPFASGIKVTVSEVIVHGGKVYANARGIYSSELNSITIKEAILSDANQLAQTFVHELVHGLTVRQIKPYVDNLESAHPQVTKPDAPAYISNLIMLYNRLRNQLPRAELNEVMAAMDAKEPLTEEEINKYYGFKNLKEFITMALTNKEFQKYLNSVPVGNKTALQRFRDLIHQILTAMGVDIIPGSAAEVAFNNIFELIEAENKKEEFDPTQMQHGDMGNMDNTTEGGYFDENNLFRDGSLTDLSPSPSDSVSSYIASLSNKEKIC